MFAKVLVTFIGR